MRRWGLTLAGGEGVRLRPITRAITGTVLASGAANLAVLPVRDVQWSDWGSPARVLTVLERLGMAPRWAGRLGLPASGAACAS